LVAAKRILVGCRQHFIGRLADEVIDVIARVTPDKFYYQFLKRTLRSPF